MKERPILFAGEMIRAILEGRKTQTRRVIKPQPIQIGIWKGSQEPVFSTNKWANVEATTFLKECPYGIPGDRLWVKESWDEGCMDCTLYKADYSERELKQGMDIFHWKSSLFLPRSRSRITLEIVKVRVDSLMSITYADCIAEGIVDFARNEKRAKQPGESPYEQYQVLWDKLNAKRGYGWDTNPYVWVIEFKRVS